MYIDEGELLFESQLLLLISS